MAVYALLIGINEYAGRVSNLSGCHNDVDRVADVLRSRYDAQDSDIKILKSQQATKSGIIDVFDNHLTNAGEGDTAFIYYSGHGSQEAAPPQFWDIEPDRQNETLVCHDSRIGAGDLADKELRFLISKVAEKNPHIVVVFDCCHSGSGTRNAGGVESAAVRLTGSDSKNRALEQYVFYPVAQQEGWVGDMKKLPEGKHIFLSGCQDSELSKELVIEGRRHGAFTHYLCKSLETTSGSLSYRNLVSRINQQVQGLVSKQHPQVEGIKGGDVDELFMGGEAQPVKYVVTSKKNKWLLGAGAIHGIQVGDQLALFKDIDDEESIAAATVVAVESQRSRLDIAGPSLDSAVAYLADVVHQVKPKLAIEISGDAEGVETAQHALANMDGDSEASHFLSEDSDNASYRLIAADNRYTVSLAIDKNPMFKPVEGGYTADNAKKALRQLEHMAKWQHKLELDNVASKIDPDAVQVIFSHDNGADIDQNFELRYTQDEDEWIAPEFGIELRLNQDKPHPKPLYCALMFFDPKKGSIQSATDNGVWLRAQDSMTQDSGAAVMLKARPSFKVFDGDMIEAEVNDKLYAQGISETSDVIKLIVSETEFNASLLEQDGLEIYDVDLDPLVKTTRATRGGDALESLLDEAIDYSNTRSLGRKRKSKLADWTSKSITLTTVRPLQTIMIPDDAVASLGLGVEVEPHPLTAGISLESQTEATRGLESVGMGHMSTPAALQDNSITPPLSLSSTRSGDSDISVIRIDLPTTRDDSTVGCESVTPENPLVISLDSKLEEGEQVLPFTFDGEFYYPLGYAVADGDKTKIRIEGLPDTIENPQSDASKELTRGLGNSLKLYFQKVVYKVLKLERDTVRLAIPEFDADDATKVVGFNDEMADIQANVKTADKVVIFIHGIIGETKSMVGALNIPLEEGERTIGQGYEAHLCFDYENLNTPIQETAQQFKKKLEEAGLKKGHGKEVHIVAHSMGGLVSRWMIEQEGGNEIVNKLVMLGTPNNGSPWAGVKDKGVSMVRKWAYGSLTLILNGLTTVPIGGVVVTGMMKLIDSIDDTLDQMGEDSDFTKSLYGSPDPKIPYYLVAGETQQLKVDVDEETGYKKVFKFALQRSKLGAYDVLSNTLFAKENDVAVNVTSMKHIKADRVPALEVSEVVSDHMSYFVTPVSVNALDKALG